MCWGVRKETCKHFELSKRTPGGQHVCISTHVCISRHAFRYQRPPLTGLLNGAVVSGAPLTGLCCRAGKPCAEPRSNAGSTASSHRQQRVLQGAEEWELGAAVCLGRQQQLAGQQRSWLRAAPLPRCALPLFLQSQTPCCLSWGPCEAVLSRIDTDTACIYSCHTHDCLFLTASVLSKPAAKGVQRHQASIQSPPVHL